MSRTRSRVVETEMVNPRILGRRAVKRQHIERWAVGRTELAPGIVHEEHFGGGVVNESHIHPTTLADLRGDAHLLTMTAVADSIGSGGDYITFGSIVAHHGFPDVAAAGDSWIHPTGGVYVITFKLAWSSYTGGGTIRLELDGAVIPEGLIVSGDSGTEAVGMLLYRAEGASVGRIAVLQTSGSSQTCDASISVAVSDPDAVSQDVSDYAATVLADGPVGYWRLGETAGTTAADLSGNGHHGTYVNTPTLGSTGLITDDPNTAVTFTRASSEYVDIGDLATFEFSGHDPFTAEAWVQLASLPGVGEYFQIVNKKAPANGAGWELFVANGGAISVAREDASGTSTVVSFSGYTTGVRYYVAASYDGTTLRLYVDGAVVAQSASSESLSATTTPVRIAGQLSEGDHMNGVTDEVAVYARALSSAEILEHYTVGTAS